VTLGTTAAREEKRGKRSISSREWQIMNGSKNWMGPTQLPALDHQTKGIFKTKPHQAGIVRKEGILY